MSLDSFRISPYWNRRCVCIHEGLLWASGCGRSCCTSRQCAAGISPNAAQPSVCRSCPGTGIRHIHPPSAPLSVPHDWREYVGNTPPLPHSSAHSGYRFPSWGSWITYCICDVLCNWWSILICFWSNSISEKVNPQNSEIRSPVLKKMKIAS